MGIIFFFALVVLFLIGILYLISLDARLKREAEINEGRIAEMVRAQGFMPFTPDADLSNKLTGLYSISGFQGGAKRYRLYHCLRRDIRDGELLLFDLEDSMTTVNESASVTKNIIAVRSARLSLPQFYLYPELDTKKNLLAKAWNALLKSGQKTRGEVVSFRAFPIFERRYILASKNPDGVRQFFDENRVRYLESIESYVLYGKGDIFAIEPNISFKTERPTEFLRRIDRALEMYRLFQNKHT